jgi:hypothetical protein
MVLFAIGSMKMKGNVMRSSRAKTPMISQIPTFVEVTSLPRIMVKAKGGTTRYAAYVNGYVCGPKCRYKGTTVVPIYYLSLVDMAGDGGKLQGIWSALISEPAQDVYLETVGTVVLAHRDPQFERLGYTIHWNYNQVLANDRENSLHAVIESNMLTLCDPTAGAIPPRRERKKAKPRHAQRSKRSARATHKTQLATVTKKELGDLEERMNREKHPLFMLMVPGSVRPASLPNEDALAYETRASAVIKQYLAALHYAFLDLRVPQPMSIEWADFLWQRAVASLENTQLKVWFKDVVQGKDESEAEENDRRAIPVLCEAWLCRPNIARLDADRRAAHREGLLSSLRDPSPTEGHHLVPA